MRFIDADIIIDGLRKAKERYLTETEDPIEREAIITIMKYVYINDRDVKINYHKCA